MSEFEDLYSESELDAMQANGTFLERKVEFMKSHQIHMYYGLLGSASRDEGHSWAAKQAAIHRQNRIPLAEAWIC